MDDLCYKCELPVTGARVTHPLLGVRHANCPESVPMNVCPNCNLILPCECQ